MFTNLLVLNWGLRYFWKRGNIKNRVRWNRRLRLLCILCIGVSGKFHLSFTLIYVLAKFLQHGAKFIQKLTPGFRQLQTSSEKFKKLKFDGLLLSKKIHLSKQYIASAKTLYTEHLSNITFNYLCENSPNYLCHFWNHKWFFTTQLLCIFLTQTLHTFRKGSPSKCKFWDSPLLGLKFKKFLSFSSKFGFFFSVMRDILLYFF